MILLDGYNVAKQRNLELKKQIDKAHQTYKRFPKLDVILVGNNPASFSYVTGKGKACKLVGIAFDLHHLDENISENDLTNLINELNNDNAVDGILLQLPLPKHLNENRLIDLISVEKDVDGFHVINQGYLYQKKDAIVCATPQGIINLLKTYDVNPMGKHAVIVGRSNIVGFPVARLLMDLGATITVCHSKTKDLAYHTKQADILVAAVGRAQLIKRDMVKDQAIVIDVGVNRIESGLVGDVDFDDVKEVASMLTPVPRGVGPMTINALLENTFKVFLKRVTK
jgi:methylenetetrahydrofolate dehydrogenase (NADP+) / methenyltetrahydrofolate cyclohydrolase